MTLLPYLSKNILNEEKNVNAFNQTIIFCLIFSIPSVFGLFYLSHDIVNVLFGRDDSGRLARQHHLMLTSPVLGGTGWVGPAVGGPNL